MTTFERLGWHQGYKQEIARISFSQWLPLMALFESLSEWQERMRQRRQLMMLDARALADIGISRADAEAEYSKFPWCP